MRPIEAIMRAANEGAVVVLVARRADRLAELASRIQMAGGHAHSIAADVARETEAHRVVTETVAQHGRVDILVNSAGIVRPGSVEEADPAHWREQIDINLLSPMYLSHAVIPGMRKRGDGHIVNVSSTAGRRSGAWRCLSSPLSMPGSPLTPPCNIGGALCSCWKISMRWPITIPGPTLPIASD